MKIMKYLLIPAVSFLSTAHAALPLRVSCATDPVTTMFDIAENGEKLEVSVLHMNGIDYAPLDVTVITPRDVESYLPKKAAALKKMPEMSTFTWPMKNCRVHDGFRFECFGTDDVQFHNGVKLAPFAAWSERIIHNNPAGSYIERAIVLSVDVDGESVHVRMVYPESGCTVNGGSLRGPFAK
ncbi:MAG: hypothetical protein HUU37_06395 [Bdellovibrionales bacterium]|nr:hypothetical protein [Bdellovibrionales bacterium]